MFDAELVPEELTQVRMGKIVKEKFPNLDDEDQEAVRQHAVAALNLVQQAKKTLVDARVRMTIPEHVAHRWGAEVCVVGEGTRHRPDRPHQSRLAKHTRSWPNR